MAKHIETEIEIDAPASTVWNILTNFEELPQWSSFIDNIDGDGRVGSKLVVRMSLPERKPMTFKPKVLAYDENRELRWIGRLLLPRIADGEHSFVIEPISENRVRFVHNETFRGILIPLIFKGMKNDVRAAFVRFNEGLKQRAEQAAASAG